MMVITQLLSPLTVSEIDIEMVSMCAYVCVYQVAFLSVVPGHSQKNIHSNLFKLGIHTNWLSGQNWSGFGLH